MKAHRRLHIAGLVTLLSITLSAQVTWTGAPDSDWATAGNWSSDPAVPTTSDDVVINGGPATVTTTDAVAGNLTIGESGPGIGELTVAAGGVLTVSTQSILGYDIGSDGVATVSGAGAIWNTGNLDLVVGMFGQGTLTISAGGVVNSSGADLASGNSGGAGATQGTVLVTGSGSAWNVTGALSIGAYANETTYNHASLTLADGGSVTVGADGTGTLSLYNNGIIRIGSEGVAGLAGTFTAGEIVFNDTGYIDDATTPSAQIPTLAFNHTDAVTFGAKLSGDGLVTKSGSGTLTLTGNGVADINDAIAFGGHVEVSEGTLVLDAGGYWDGDGEFTVTGADTTLSIAAGTVLANDLDVTDGTVEVAGVLEYGYYGHSFTDATLHVLSGGSIVENSLTLQGTSTLVLDSTAGLVDSQLALLGGVTVTLGADQALDNTYVVMIPDGADPLIAPEINLNGHDVTFAGINAYAGRIINNSTTPVTITIGEDCGCGYPSNFFGAFVENPTGKISVSVIGGTDLVISGTQTYTGPTLVDNAGFYVISSLDADDNVVPGVLTGSPITLQNGGTLGGDGTVGDVTILDGGILAPGYNLLNPVGTFTANTITFVDDPLVAEASELAFTIYDATAAPGFGTDFLNVTGVLTFSPDPLDTYTVFIRSLGDLDNLALNFDAASSRTWIITSAMGGIFNFDPSRFFVDAALFENADGLWTVTLGMGDTELHLNYAPIPEPTAYALLGSLAILPALLRRRRPRG